MMWMRYRYAVHTGYTVRLQRVFTNFWILSTTVLTSKGVFLKAAPFLCCQMIANVVLMTNRARWVWWPCFGNERRKTVIGLAWKGCPRMDARVGETLFQTSLARGHSKKQWTKVSDLLQWGHSSLTCLCPQCRSRLRTFNARCRIRKLRSLLMLPLNGSRTKCHRSGGAGA